MLHIWEGGLRHEIWVMVLDMVFFVLGYDPFLHGLPFSCPREVEDDVEEGWVL